MHSFAGIRASAIAFVALCLIGGAQGAHAAGSAASGLFADFTVGGVNTAISPVNRLDSSGLGSSYDKTAKSASYHRQLVLSTEGDMQPILTVDAANIISHVAGGFGVDTISSKGAAEVLGLNVGLVPKRAPGLAIVPFLQISAHGLFESGSYNHVVPSFTTVSGFAGIKDLVISGSLVGNQTLHFSGPSKQNQILYQSPTVTIMLNQTTSTELISCEPKCVVTPYSVRTSALNISLTGAPIGPRKVTGQLVIGAADAGIEGSF